LKESGVSRGAAVRNNQKKAIWQHMGNVGRRSQHAGPAGGVSTMITTQSVASARAPTSKVALSKRNGARYGFDPESFLATAGVGRKVVHLEKKQVLFSQGETANAIFYVQKGKLKLTVVSKRGKEATIALLASGEFVGEACIAAAQPLRQATATAITDCEVLRITRRDMLRVLHEQHAFSDVFVSFLLARNARIQEDLVDQLFNSSEKRLARILLLLAQFGKDGKPEKVIPKISQETLAEMIGTTRSRVSFFMNRFRKLGFIKYNGTMQIHSSLLNVILHD
jgi:CRP/FNR family cyclic AMP-dependent transcriptional regulator